VLLYGDPDRPWRGALIMTAAALAVTTPSFQWYALLLVMLVALDGQPEWLAFAAGAYYAAEPGLGRAYAIPNRFHDAVAYGVPVLVVAVGSAVRWELAAGAGSGRRGSGWRDPGWRDPGWRGPGRPSPGGARALARHGRALPRRRGARLRGVPGTGDTRRLA
jgi:hypothetical protein